ncbi:MAG: 16S rRNA (cytidine(1402)-2'-O)-methyltransferase [Bacillota bacterium]
MDIQQSFKENKPTLFIVSTPIGNLEDITYRAVNILKTVDVIYAEDTRTSGVLLKYYEIETHMKSYHKHNERMRNETIIKTLNEGKYVALISDAGTPLISDPGETLVQDVISANYPVVSIPGPSAFLTALTASPLPTHPFVFYGFLPTKESAQKKQLSRLKTYQETLIFYEAPHRISQTLKTLYDVFGNRRVTLARELTKHYEEYRHFTLEDHATITDLKGEMVIIVAGSETDAPLSKDDAIAHIELLIEDGFSEKDAIKTAAKKRNMKKNEVYMAFQNHKKRNDHNG